MDSISTCAQVIREQLLNISGASSQIINQPLHRFLLLSTKPSITLTRNYHSSEVSIQNSIHVLLQLMLCPSYFALLLFVDVKVVLNHRTFSKYVFSSLISARFLTAPTVVQ